VPTTGFLMVAVASVSATTSKPWGCCAAGFQFNLCRVGVKSGKARCEHIPSGLPPRADIVNALWHFRFVPGGDLSRCSNVREQSYSITSSARTSSVEGMSMPSALAVIKLMTNSNLVGCSTGRSEGFDPRKILST
jgi:hypothetical protein